MRCPMQKMQAGFIVKARVVPWAEETGRQAKAGSSNLHHWIPNFNYGSTGTLALRRILLIKKLFISEVSSCTKALIKV